MIIAEHQTSFMVEGLVWSLVGCACSFISGHMALAGPLCCWVLIGYQLGSQETGPLFFMYSHVTITRSLAQICQVSKEGSRSWQGLQVCRLSAQSVTSTRFHWSKQVIETGVETDFTFYSRSFKVALQEYREGWAFVVMFSIYQPINAPKIRG